MKQKARLKRIEDQAAERDAIAPNPYMDMPLAQLADIVLAVVDELKHKPTESLTHEERYILDNAEREAA